MWFNLIFFAYKAFPPQFDNSQNDTFNNYHAIQKGDGLLLQTYFSFIRGNAKS